MFPKYFLWSDNNNSMMVYKQILNVQAKIACLNQRYPCFSWVDFPHYVTNCKHDYELRIKLASMTNNSNFFFRDVFVLFCFVFFFSFFSFFFFFCFSFVCLFFLTHCIQELFSMLIKLVAPSIDGKITS